MHHRAEKSMSEIHKYTATFSTGAAIVLCIYLNQLPCTVVLPSVLREILLFVIRVVIIKAFVTY